MARSDGYVVSGFFQNSRDTEFVKRNAFHEHGMLVIDLNDDRIGWDERQVLKNIGEKLFGRATSAPRRG